MSSSKSRRSGTDPKNGRKLDNGDGSQHRRLRALETNLVDNSQRGGDLRVHLVYPNTYWIGMSNLGFQAVYGLLAAIPGVVVERAFLPDDLKVASASRKPWRTFESERLLGDCDVLAFSLSFETDYPHLLKLLGRANALFESASDRLNQQQKFPLPLILAGGTAVTLNPEPVADFIDAILIGEAEEFIPEFVSTLRETRGQDRVEVLAALSKLSGLYVPHFYQPIYTEDRKIFSYTRTALAEKYDVPLRAKRRFVKDISKYPTYSKILSPETEFRSMFLTETGRGCEMGCRFCVAGYIYRPVRKRKTEVLEETLKIGLENSNAVGFVGAAVSSHKGISHLASQVARRGARASLSSIMSQQVTQQLSASLSESEYKTVALAPEAGSERLRRAAGKRVGNQQILEAAKSLAQAEIRGFKLYFIVGLPTENDQDVEAIAELSKQVRDVVVEATRGRGRAAWVSLSINPFIPKASTPFQWEPMLDRKELESKIERVRQIIKGEAALEMRFETPKESYFQALMSRGDRRVAKLLWHIEQNALDWQWLIKNSATRSILEGVPEIDFYVKRRIEFNERLPWEVVDSGIDRRLLEREARRAYLGEEFVLKDDDLASTNRLASTDSELEALNS